MVIAEADEEEEGDGDGGAAGAEAEGLTICLNRIFRSMIGETVSDVPTILLHFAQSGTG